MFSETDTTSAIHAHRQQHGNNHPDDVRHIHHGHHGRRVRHTEPPHSYILHTSGVCARPRTRIKHSVVVRAIFGVRNVHNTILQLHTNTYSTTNTENVKMLSVFERTLVVCGCTGRVVSAEDAATVYRVRSKALHLKWSIRCRVLRLAAAKTKDEHIFEHTHARAHVRGKCENSQKWENERTSLIKLRGTGAPTVPGAVCVPLYGVSVRVGLLHVLAQRKCRERCVETAHWCRWVFFGIIRQ